MSQINAPISTIIDETAKLLSPRPAELVTLPSYMNSHDHNYTQIVIGLKGQVDFDVNGRGNLMGPGQGCVVTCGSGHAFGGVIEQSDILVLNMPLPSNDDPLLLQKINELASQDIYFQLDDQIQKLIHMLVIEMKTNPEDLLLSRACNDTLISLLQRHISTFQLTRKDCRFDLDAIDRYIDNHMMNKISVAQLAGSVFLGESQFHMLFKDKLGMTPHQYVLQKRVEMAKTLITQGQFTLGQVADLTGFSNQSSFTHTFSRIAGVSPSVFKKRIKN
ncbi:MULTISPECIES: helix-turn-helix domain-containing protein [Vibrio]|uniref:Helix-turn-helix domain-containing protein n=2 Tax=Vibrio TaxID=662 RepID=A0A7X4LPK4_9VIBR|nr:MULTISPECIES: AraC family transcriptional regulator [Vibrio]MBF9003419.1 helix-turn-helix domain-containing protein [Vibrio nitrifigilis]MZI95266.1 helix-turn-helix domain-containing protein [Vibrio eleionomae]